MSKFSTKFAPLERFPEREISCTLFLRMLNAGGATVSLNLSRVLADDAEVRGCASNTDPVGSRRRFVWLADRRRPSVASSVVERGCRFRVSCSYTLLSKSDRAGDLLTIRSASARLSGGHSSSSAASSLETLSFRDRDSSPGGGSSSLHAIAAGITRLEVGQVAPPRTSRVSRDTPACFDAFGALEVGRFPGRATGRH